MSSPAVQFPSRSLRTVSQGLADRAVARARLHVVPRRRASASTMPFLVLVTLVLVGGVVSLLLFNTFMQQASFAASDLERQAATLTAREQTLQMELEDLRNPQRVAERAQQMGMVLPASSAFLSLADGSVTDAGHATETQPTLRLEGRPPRRPAILDPRPATQNAATHRDTGHASPGAQRDRDRNGEDRRG